MARGRVAAVGDNSHGGVVDTDYNLVDYSANLSAQDYWLGDVECEAKDHTYHPKVLAMYYIYTGVYPALLLQGIIGNALAIPVLVSLGRSAWSTLIYLAVLGFTDLFVLLARCGDEWYAHVTGESLSEQIVNSSDAACRTYYFVFAFVSHINPWLMVTAAIEMTIMTKWPKSTHKACTLERARYVMMLLMLILICLDLNHFWTYGVPSRPGVGCRYLEETSESFRDWIWPALNNAVLFVLPLVTVSVCSIITAIILIRRTSIREEEMRNYMRKYFLELPALLDFRSVVLVLSVLFLLLIIYQTTRNFIMYLFTRGFFDHEDCDHSQEIMMTLQLLQTLDMTLSFLFYSGKIYIYLGLSLAFRARLALGFRTAWKRLVRLIRLCSCSCVDGRPRWTLVARDDDTLTNSTGHKKKPGQPQMETRLPDDGYLGIEGHTFIDGDNSTSRGNQSLNATQSNHDNRKMTRAQQLPRPGVGAGPSQYACRTQEENTGERRRNGEAVRPRNPSGSSKQQEHRPNRGRGKEHTVIALESENPSLVDSSRGKNRPLSFGDHFV